jgi:diaminohydroxyphosphoribosylaminopyrimidine deaminase/5-amino-6-(5-phosphoribosylamino)uracil reductase
MRTALRLAARARGMTSPNPLVGAVVVNRGKVVGTGYHHRFGMAHAETLALRDAGRRAHGGELYVNLEPCAHHGHTPPCASGIVEAGIKRVHVAIVDPDRRVHGRGIRFLRSHGVKVDIGLLAEEAKRLNEAYLKQAQTGLPFVALKLCESLDGRIAAQDGTSRGLGSPEEIAFVHGLRAAYDAVLVGSGTALTDDPRLTVRRTRGRNPHRILLDSRLRLPLNSRVLKPRKDERVIVAALRDGGALRRSANSVRRKVDALSSRGVEVWLLPGKDGRVDLRALVRKATLSRIQSVLVEGGGEVATSLIREKLADKAYVAISPRILGGNRGVWPGDVGVNSVGKAIKLKHVRLHRLGDNVLVEGYF